MFENENRSQSSRSYAPNISSHHPRSEVYGDTRRKIPLGRSAGTLREGMSPHHQDAHDMSFNTDIKQEEEDYSPSSNYLSDKPRMSLRERYSNLKQN